MTDKPRFALELSLSRIATKVTVEDTSLISDKRLDHAWNLMSDFVMDLLDDLELEVDDERFREIFLEVCYRIIYREMFQLHIMPIWEKAWQEDLGTRRTGVRGHRKGPYDDK